MSNIQKETTIFQDKTSVSDRARIFCTSFTIPACHRHYTQSIMLDHFFAI